MISRTIDYILAQQCSYPFEIVIGDDCSSDNTRNILSEYKERYPDMIRLIFHEENMGVGANWATCVKSCESTYIAGCDDDDYWHCPTKLQIQVDFLEANPQIGLCYTDHRTENLTTGEVSEYVCKDLEVEDNASLQRIAAYGRFDGLYSTNMFRASILKETVNFDDYINYRFPLQDWGTWIMVASQSMFGCLHVSTTTYNVGAISITNNSDLEKLKRRFRRESKYYKYVCELYPNVFDYRAEDYEEYANIRLLGAAYKNSDFKNAKLFGRDCKSKSIKVRCSQNIIMFYMYRIAQSLKRRVM